MSETKLFRGNDLDLTPDENGANVVACINASVSEGLGGGIGVFAGADVPWTVTYDEILFVIEGSMELQVGDDVFEAGAGDMLWIPAGTELVYRAPGHVKFFFAVNPATKSPSGSDRTRHPTVAPRKAD